MNALLGSKQITAASLLVLVADEDAAVRQYLADVDGRAAAATKFAPPPPPPPATRRRRRTPKHPAAVS